MSKIVWQLTLFCQRTRVAELVSWSCAGKQVRFVLKVIDLMLKLMRLLECFTWWNSTFLLSHPRPSSQLYTGAIGATIIELNCIALPLCDHCSCHAIYEPISGTFSGDSESNTGDLSETSLLNRVVYGEAVVPAAAAEQGGECL